MKELGIAVVLVAIVAFFVAMPWWPTIQSFTNSTSFAGLNLDSYAGTPLESFLHLFGLFAILITIFAVIYLVVIQKE